MHDYILIGAGAAGCVLASRLTENRDITVLLIEAGPPDRRREIRVPAMFSKLFKTSLDWNYTTESQKHLDGRRLYWPRGKMLGGSGSMNAMVYIRGRRSDFDGWRDLGNPGWGFDDVLPCFQAAETLELNIADLRYVNPLSHAFLEACSQAGISSNSDFNGATQEGAGLYRVTQKKGRRWSAADAYLRPALRRGNLTTWTGIHATRVLIENGRATGVEYLQDGSLRQIRAAREVVLCAGAIGSPQLLLLSGIGPRRALESLEIPVAADLPGVGQNLQDHLSIGVNYFCTQPVSLSNSATFANRLRYRIQRNGPLASNIAEAGAFVRSRPDAECDLQFHFVPLHYIEHGFCRPAGHGFSLCAALLSPKSRGQITLRSANPFDAPSINPAYLSEPADVAPLAEGVRLAQQVIAQKAFDPFRGEPVFTPMDPEAFVRAHAETLYHPAGTCRMGDDASSVVSSSLEVHQVAGLRVVDASVMPVIVRGNPQAATMMIAEKVARMMREKSA